MPTLNREDIKKLKAFNANGHPVVSVYWTIRRGATELSMTQLRNKLNEAASARKNWLGAERETKDDLARIHKLAQEEQTQSAGSLAVFASSAAGLWQVFHLHAPVTNRVVIDERPYVRPLIRIFHEQIPYAIVLVDQSHARFYLWRSGALEARGELVSDVPREDQIGKMREERFQRHQEEWIHRHLKQTSDKLLALWQTDPFKGLWIGGNETVGSLLQNDLHSYLTERLCGSFAIDLIESEPELKSRIEPLIDAREKQDRAKLLERLETAAKSGGAGAIGIDDTLTEWQSGKVMTLLVERNYAIAGGRCTNCGSLTVNSQAPCAYCASKVKAVDNVVDELIEDAFVNGTEVVFVPVGEGLGRLGSIGALLRFS